MNIRTEDDNSKNPIMSFFLQGYNHPIQGIQFLQINVLYIGLIITKHSFGRPIYFN